MSKARKKINDRQIAFDFDRAIDDYGRLKETIIRKTETVPLPTQGFEDACVKVAVACKHAIRKKGLSREQVCDGINEYFGWSERLSIHMLNHYLSKPTEYYLPAYMIFAIQRVTGSLEPASVFAEAEDGQVISGDEKRQMALGKIDEMVGEMQRLKKELKNG